MEAVIWSRRLSVLVPYMTDLDFCSTELNTLNTTY